ncbi:MAG: hypothetical protein AAGC69_04275 [Paracraurococcus sp.]
MSVTQARQDRTAASQSGLADVVTIASLITGQDAPNSKIAMSSKNVVELSIRFARHSDSPADDDAECGMLEGPSQFSRDLSMKNS